MERRVRDDRVAIPTVAHRGHDHAARHRRCCRATEPGGRPAVGRQAKYPDRCAPARRGRSLYHLDGATRTSNVYAARSAPWDVAPRLTPLVRPTISQMIRRSRSGAAQGS